METSLQATDDQANQEFLNLVQVKQEADEEPHIVYDDKEQWAFLFNDAVNELKPEIANINNENVVLADNVEDYLSEDEIQKCHWCSYTTTESLELIEHDFEKHSRFFQGRRIYKSYKCPSCEYTSIDPANIRSHFESSHSKFPEPDDSNSRKENRAYNLQRNTKKKKRKQSWQTKLSKQREQRRLIRELEENGLIPKPKNVASDEQRLKRMLQARKYRAALSPEALSRRRIKDAARMRMKRAMEPEEVKAERRRKQAQHAREKRATETPQQLEYRRTMQRNRAKVRRSLETEEQRERRKERERLRARERRATMTTDKKERIKEVERLRKRYARQKTNVSISNDFVHSAELLASSLATCENPYQQLNNLCTYPQNCIENEDDLMRFCTVSMHMLTDSNSTPTTLSNTAAIKTNKKRVRSRSKVNSDEKSSEAVSYETLTTSSRVSSLSTELSSEQQPYTVKHLDIMARLHSEIDTVNSFWKSTDTMTSQVTEKPAIVEIKKEVVIKEEDELLIPDEILHQEDQSESVSVSDLQESHESKIEVVLPLEVQEDSTLNCLKYSPLTKMDKINKLLERMSGKSEN
ncbi:uncharacterized protein [Rhodnius prolixus]|uniref:uncharacterized protein n=1 Tax=Rhodnius prolixus TaxID=13249 RepID=UPI003D18B4D9